MPKKIARIPKYCLHKPSGRAYMRIHGRVIYLGKYNSPESKKAYGHYLAELDAESPTPLTLFEPDEDLTVVELCDLYLIHCEKFYQKDGEPTRHVDAIKRSIRLILSLYAETPAAEFGPKALKSLRQTMINNGLSRTYINDQVENLKCMFRWAVSEELLPASIDQALRAVGGLKKGRTEARETKPVAPVADDVVNATLECLPTVVADMVRLQRLTGARPGEICQLRPQDVKRTGEVWEYLPATHKTEHQNKTRIVFIGPRAQGVLRPYFDRPADKFCFSPAESENERNADRRVAHKSKVYSLPQNRRKRHPLRRPADHYCKDAYRRAIVRAVAKANKRIQVDAELMGIEIPALLPHWHPNQLRHTAATEIRKQFGLEAAQVILGHATADVTQVYAERDARLGKEIAKQIG